VSELPKTAQSYVQALEEMSGAPISAIGVGPAATRPSKSARWSVSGHVIPYDLVPADLPGLACKEV